MPVSVFDLFKVGIGPSSSHTVGPMVAASRFLDGAVAAGVFEQIAGVTCELFGSLALTGRGHGSDRAIVLGLLGLRPDAIAPTTATAGMAELAPNGQLMLLGRRAVEFDPSRHLVFRTGERLPRHPNGMHFTARDAAGEVLRESRFYSIGGGFVIGDDDDPLQREPGPPLPYPYGSAAELLAMASAAGLTIAGLVHSNEKAVRSSQEIAEGLDRIWSTMRAAIERGIGASGDLPGSARIRRRAPALHRRLADESAADMSNRPLHDLDWVMAFAIAVNEENAAGGQIVTAPTNGAAGIIPAVLEYYCRFYTGADRDGVHNFLLTAAAIGSLYKINASISGAEVGCQGEVGVACSMAAAGLAAVLGGSNDQVENAAEIGMEHNLGLTCDPVGGLVQIPCIERNAIGAAKAITAARLALSGDGQHHVSLDAVIETMRQTGVDMQTKYKETSLGGLAVNVPLC